MKKKFTIPVLKPLWLFMLFCTSCMVVFSQQKGWITAGVLKVYYESHGKGKALLFIHAGYLDHTMWDNQVALFSKQYQVVTIDLPGHGKTTGNDSITPIAMVIKTCLDSLHIAKTSFIGLSLGGATVNDFAIAYPGMINKIILVSSGLNGAPPVVQADSISNAVFSKWDAAKHGGNNDTLAKVVTAMCFEGPFRKASAVNAGTRLYIQNKVTENLRVHANDHWPVFQSNTIAATQVNTVKATTLIIVANKDVPYFAAISNYLHAQIKASTLLVFRNAAHMLSLEQPSHFNREVNAFLRG